jgi:hypothetical protein
MVQPNSQWRPFTPRNEKQIPRGLKARGNDEEDLVRRTYKVRPLKATL